MSKQTIRSEQTFGLNIRRFTSFTTFIQPQVTCPFVFIYAVLSFYIDLFVPSGAYIFDLGNTKLSICSPESVDFGAEAACTRYVVTNRVDSACKLRRNSVFQIIRRIKKLMVTFFHTHLHPSFFKTIVRYPICDSLPPLAFIWEPPKGVWDYHPLSCFVSVNETFLVSRSVLLQSLLIYVCTFIQINIYHRSHLGHSCIC